MKQGILKLIVWYQRGISPLFPPCCRFTPSCSQYAVEAIERFGLFFGGWLAFKRLCRCHPFHRDATMMVDPVPSKKQ